MALKNTVGGAYDAATVKNNNGTIVKAGNVAADGPVTKVLGLNDLADDQGASFGSKVLANVGTGAATTDRVGVSGAIQAVAVDGASIVFNANATQWVMQGGNVTTSLGGVANTALIGGARDYNGDLNDFLTEANRVIIDTERVGASGFDIFAVPSTQIVPGRTLLAEAGDASVFVNPADGNAAVATDIAPSQAVPGELTYHFGALAKPTTDEYKAKNVLES